MNPEETAFFWHLGKEEYLTWKLLFFRQNLICKGIYLPV